jgi:tetratricopeptide (TPR) repeat protein
MTRRILAVALFTLFLVNGAAIAASWYDYYDEGLAAVRSGNWNVAAEKMTAAIKGNPNENNRARTYGAIFINYHPYYYRAVANLNLGRYEQAVSDLEKATGPGPDNLGTVESLMDRAKRQLAAASAPPPEPVRTEPVRPPPTVQPTPAVPQIDATLRQRAAAAIQTATQKVRSAQQRRADSSPQYAQAMSMLTEATTKNATVRTNDDLGAVISLAENAATLADLAMPPSTPAPSQPAIVPRPTAATSTVMADYTDQVRRALEYYFAGEFETASREFEELSSKMPNNAWIWAFLGASQYSQYAFEADERYRAAAERSFRRAKQLRSGWKEGLPSQYFSRRIRKAFDDLG